MLASASEDLVIDIAHVETGMQGLKSSIERTRFEIIQKKKLPKIKVHHIQTLMFNTYMEIVNVHFGDNCILYSKMFFQKVLNGDDWKRL